VFSPGDSGTAAGAVGAAACLALVATLLLLRTRPVEDGLRRWLRAAAYFSLCVLAAWTTGVLDRVLTGSVTGSGSGAGFALAVLGCCLVEVVAYGVVWPRGTYTLDRPRDLAAAVPFGLVWGGCEGLLLLSIWAVVEQTGWPRWGVALGTFAIASAVQGGWHAAYWDRWVAPEHNIPEWNLPKVLLCHVPNLTVTLTFLAVYRAPLLFVAFQTISLVLSTVAMRFPRPYVAAVVRS
jgi:hypothetical protein